MDFRDAIIEEMTIIAEDESYFTEEDFTVLKGILEDETLIEVELPSSFINTLSFWWASASTDYYLGYVDNMKRVEYGDIRGYLTAYVLDKPSIVSVRISPEDFREAESLEAGVTIITKENAFWWREY
jgi:zinc protease